MKSDQLKRRSFLKKFTIVSVSVMVAPSCIGRKDDSIITPPENECQTTADILGPFYKPGAPFREDIAPSGASGLPMTIKGKVYGNCDTPLKEAMVEIWNADNEGNYDGTQSATFNFRGRNLTTDDGAYKFKTIVPGKYLNGGTFRPSHIHFKITAPGHRELVSQIYFKDDPDIAADPWAKDPKAESRILALEKDENGLDSVDFDIYLVKV